MDDSRELVKAETVKTREEPRRAALWVVARRGSGVVRPTGDFACDARATSDVL